MTSIIIACARFVIRVFHALILYLPSEFAHRLFVVGSRLPILGTLGLLVFRLSRRNLPTIPRSIGTLRMDNPIGIAAGFDKNGEVIHALDALGFGFIEIGTVTPKPQPGNPKPRILKLHKQKALVNAMGFNNAGVTSVHARLVDLPIRLKQRIMVSISKNKDSEDWLLDIKTCMAALWFDCGAICVNISSPNTPGLRNLQSSEQITKISALYDSLKMRLGETNLYSQSEIDKRYPLLACKLSPDLNDMELRECLDAIEQGQYGAVVLTNTTLEHPYTLNHAKGGLSGAPLKDKSNHALTIAANQLKGKVPIIATGGILSVEDAQEKFRLGASAIQIYTGFIFYGPALLWDLISSSPKNPQMQGFTP